MEMRGFCGFVWLGAQKNITRKKSRLWVMSSNLYASEETSLNNLLGLWLVQKSSLAVLSTWQVGLVQPAWSVCPTRPGHYCDGFPARPREASATALSNVGEPFNYTTHTRELTSPFIGVS